MTHEAVAIVPSSDLPASRAFYARLGLEVVSDYGDYLIMEDANGAALHLRHQPGWPRRIEDNPFGIYLYVDDVDAVAERVADLIIEPGTPHLKPWGTYEFAVSDPTGVLVRIGKVAESGSAA